jgi:hypothetical protein
MRVRRVLAVLVRGKPDAEDRNAVRVEAFARAGAALLCAVGELAFVEPHLNFLGDELNL